MNQKGYNKKSSLWSRELNLYKATMLDTIIARTEYKKLQQIGISIPMRSLVDNGLFQKNIKSSNAVFQFNPSDEFVKKNGYYPNITISYFKSHYNNDWLIYYLKIQCSAPKLIYGSSYYLVDEDDLDIFCQTLSQKFMALKIPLDTDKIKELDVSAFSIAYNIFLPERFGKPSTFLKRMLFLDINKQFRNVMNTEYNETVEGLRGSVYSQNTSYKIYDKGSEIQNQPKTPEEYRLAEKIKKKEIPSCILRLEKTFQRKVAVRAVVNQNRTLKIQDIKIKNLFDNKLCKGNLIEMIEKLGKTLNLVALDTAHRDNFLSTQFAMEEAKRLGLKGNKAIFFTLYTLSVGQMGVKLTNTLIDEVFGRVGQKYRNLYINNINKFIQKTNLKDFYLVDLFAVIKKQIEEFRIYRNELQVKEVYAQIIQQDQQHQLNGQIEPIQLSFAQLPSLN